MFAAKGIVIGAVIRLPPPFVVFIIDIFKSFVGAVACGQVLSL